MYSEFIIFVRRLYNKPEGEIPLHEPRFVGNEKKYLNECIDSTFVSSVGKFVGLFEKKVAEFTGAKYAVAAVNGTSALHIALILAGVKGGDEVIMQPLTFVATANAIKYCGADPVFVDVDLDTLGLSPEKLDVWLKGNTIYRKSKLINKITGKHISAVVPMHTFGHPCRIDKIVEVCDKYGLPVIEDAAESLGSIYKNKHTGTFGKIGVLSFNGNKIITTGGGGMIITDYETIARKAKHLTTQAKVSHPWEYIHDEIGYNYRLTNLAAALGVAQMEQLPRFLEAKRELAKKYKEFFSNTDIQFLVEPYHSRSNYWLNAILLPNKKEKGNFLRFTNKNKIMTRPVWRLMKRLDIYKNNQNGDLSIAKCLEDRVVNLQSSVIL